MKIGIFYLENIFFKKRLFYKMQNSEEHVSTFILFFDTPHLANSIKQSTRVYEYLAKVSHHSLVRGPTDSTSFSNKGKP